MSAVHSVATTITQGQRRWLRPALIGSLALNVLVAAAIGVSLWQWRHAAPIDNPPARFPVQLTAFAETLPAAAARAGELKQMVVSSEPEIATAVEAARNARREAVHSFVADPFDKGQFIAAQNRLLESEFNVRRAQVRLVADIAEKLSASERRAFLKWRREGRARTPRPPVEHHGSGSEAGSTKP